MPFFSVVMPVYNKGPHVARAIRSVLDQTFDDFELILINDASTDNSLEEMTKFVDSRIRLLHRQEPGPGGYAARNFGIREAQTEWVAFLDADDEWFTDHLEKMRALLSVFPEAGFLSCGWLNDNGKTSRVDRYYETFSGKRSHTISCADYFGFFLKGMKPVWTGTVVFNKSAPFSGSLFPEDKKELKTGGDLYAWSRLICWFREMAWSPHLAGVYHRDSVNMVTRTERASPEGQKAGTEEILEGVSSPDERRLIKKVHNHLLFNLLKMRAAENNGSFPVFKYLYFDVDLFRGLFWSVFSLLPNSISSFLIQKYRKEKGFLRGE